MTENNKNLYEQLLRAGALLHRHQVRNFRDYGPFGNPHKGQGRVLSILKLKPEISQKELGYLLDMRNQSMGELLAKLERGGFIAREQSEQDRRVMNIRLTPEGAKAAEEMEGAEPSEEEFFNCLNDEERELFGEYLGRTIQNLERLTGSADEDGPERGGRFGGRHGGPGGREKPHGMGHGYEPRGREAHGHGHEGRGHGRQGNEGRDRDDLGPKQ